MDLQSISNIIISLLTLTFLEIVLGVDNLVFIAIISSRLPVEQQPLARRLGLLFALVTRLILLASVVWLIGLTKPLFTIFAHAFSVRDIVLILGGLFLLFKSTLEIHSEFESASETKSVKKFSSMVAVVIQIGILDIIFSLDSILTAIGLTQQFWIMACAIIIAVILMLCASEPLNRFINKYPTIKMLALSFLLLIGTVLIADGLSFAIPHGYIYFAVCFSVFVEFINTLLARKRKNKEHAAKQD
jgi:predicted tellurium resistance membrane protein TerC